MPYMRSIALGTADCPWMANTTLGISKLTVRIVKRVLCAVKIGLSSDIRSVRSLLVGYGKPTESPYVVNEAIHDSSAQPCTCYPMQDPTSWHTRILTYSL